jgi:hypothetical protein
VSIFASRTLSSRRVPLFLSCLLEWKTRSGNEAGNAMTETGIGTHGEVGVVVDLTGVKAEDDPVGHAVRAEFLTEIWIETDGEEVCLSV